MNKPTVLIILDGFGLRAEKKDNGILLASTKNWDHLLKTYPHTQIEASGPAVGLPVGIMGNSEVGHMNMGAGRVVYTGLSQIYQAIADGSFVKNEALLQAMAVARKNNKALHLMGLVSDGAVHSHQDHLYALLDLAKERGVTEVFVHCFLDGRDTPPNSAVKYLTQLEDEMNRRKVGRIASICGRFYAMDRDKRWDRVEKAYDVLTGRALGGNPNPLEIVHASYKQGVFDEFVVPQMVVNEEGAPIGPISDGDAVIFFNFRADRAREITQALTQKNFDGFERKACPQLGSYICMAPYDEKFNLQVAFLPTYPKLVLSEIVSRENLTQLHIAETEKYAHVTFFFNGGSESPFPGEERILIPSPREVPTYDLKPEMSASKIASTVVERIEGGKDDFIVMNFANPDMVGHTAKPGPITSAIETIDVCLGAVVEAVLSKGGELVITADHGNAEQMVDANGEPHTAHTTNPVPFVLVSERLKKSKLAPTGKLCDVAPTLLQLMGIPQPSEMTGKSLII